VETLRLQSCKFSLSSTDGSKFHPDAIKNKILILYFYPKDATPGCTNESTQFRDLNDKFSKLSCVIYGVSRDTIKSHLNFKSKLSLPFELLSDTKEQACTFLKVIKIKNLYGRRVRGIERSTFVFDQAGYLVKEWRGVRVTGHAQKILDFVKTLNGQCHDPT
jgi:peroxiredoxin Q/BCP